VEPAAADPPSRPPSLVVGRPLPTRTRLGRRAAWQLRLLPLRREDGLLIVATTADRLARAATWAGRRIGEPVHLVIADREALHRGLARAYPCPALAALDRGRVRRGAA